MRTKIRTTFFLALCSSLSAACPAKEPKETPPQALAAYANGAMVHVIDVIDADSHKPVYDVRVPDDVTDLAWLRDGRIAALTRSGAVHVVDKSVTRAAIMPPASAWGSGPANTRLFAHLEEQQSVKARRAAGEQLAGDHDQQFGSDPYPSMAKLVRVESGDVELVSCQFYDDVQGKPHCQDWVWSTLDPATTAFGRVSAPGPAYQDPDEHAAPAERMRARPPSREAPLRATLDARALSSTSP